VTNVGIIGGGGGAGNGGAGGGTLTMLAQTAVVNAPSATIEATGQDADLTTAVSKAVVVAAEAGS